MKPNGGDIPYIIAPSTGGTSDLIAPEFPEGIALRHSGVWSDKEIVSTVGPIDKRVWGLFDNCESFVPTALNHCFIWVYPGMNSGAIKSVIRDADCFEQITGIEAL